MEGIQHQAKLAKVEGLAEKRIRAELVGTVDILRPLGRSQHNYQHPAKAGLAANPLQNFESVSARHFKIQKQESRKRIFRAIGEFAVAIQVSNDFVTVAHHLQGALVADVLKGATEHEDVILTVVGEKNDRLIAFGHAGSMENREGSNQDKNKN